MPFAPISQILEELRAGRMIVLVDDEQRENEGDLICAAERTSPQIVNFMTRHARGVLCVALDGATCDRLELAPQSLVNTAQLGTAFTVSVDAHPRFGVSTGVSAADRATTIRLLADPQTRPSDLMRPGHINPLRARDGGVLVRTGQTEGSVDLCRMAGLRPAAVVIEIMNDDGTMARLPELQELCRTHNLKMCTVADIVAMRLSHEKLVERIGQAPLQTPHGPFTAIVYRSRVDPLLHVALCAGRVGQAEISDPVLVRVHAQNLLGDVFADVSQSTQQTLHQCMRRIQAAGEGAIVYLRQDISGANLLKHLRRLQGVAPPTGDDLNVPKLLQSDATTNIGIGSQILRDLGIHRLRLLTHHAQHYHAVEGFGLSIEELVEPDAKF